MILNIISHVIFIRSFIFSSDFRFFSFEIREKLDTMLSFIPNFIMQIKISKKKL